MKKLADISAFEGLQGQSPNTVSDMAVFNFEMPIWIEDWEDFKRFILGVSPGDWTARRFDVIDELGDEATSALFSSLEALYERRKKGDEWSDVLNRKAQYIDTVIRDLEYYYSPEREKE